MYDLKAETGQGDTLRSLRSEELAAQKTAMIGRTLALMFIAVLVGILSPWPAPLFTYLLLVAFVVLGWAAWFVARSNWGRPWHQYAFVFADFALLSFTLVTPNPLVPFDYAPQFTLRYGSFIYFFVLVAGLAYVYQPKLVLWGGLSGAICWAVGVGWLFSLPDTIYEQPGDYNFDTAMALVSQPTFIDLGERTQEIAVLLIVACLLALAVRRSKRIAQRQVTLARERENLGRYFPRKTAQMLAERSDPFSQPSEQRAAVVFADLVAFTTWSEARSPRETIELLREVHGLLADIVFRHNGTLDKFIGDGLMATFGTPEPSGRDASNALAAITEMVAAFEQWQQQQAPDQAKELQLAVGAHYGPVVVGNIGSSTRLEFAVLGDTVNVASRLEGATRDAKCRLLASADLIRAAAAETASPDRNAAGHLQPAGAIKLRGRHQEIDVYRL